MLLCSTLLTNRMIKNKEDFRQYVEADCNANLNVIRLPWWKEMLFRIYQKDAWMAFDYLRSLRKYEYAINTSRTSIIGRICTKYYQFLNRKKSIKYNISIGANMVGAGIRIAHVVGGVL